MELFQEKVLNRVPFLAAHYEGHAHQPEEPPTAQRVREPVRVSSDGNGNGDDER
jgi:hypothetical protein